MEERSAPWWRRALSYALDGIRSGFGLFLRSAKSKAAIEPEIASGNEDDPDKEAELTSHSPKPEPIAEAETEAEAVLAPEASVATAEPETPVEAVPESSPVQAFTPPVPESEPESSIESVAEHEPSSAPAVQERVEEVVLATETLEESAATAPLSPTVAEETFPETELIEEQIVAAETLSEVASSEETDPPQVDHPIVPFDRVADFEDAPEADPEEDLEPEAEFEIAAEPEPEPEFESEVDPDPGPDPEPEPEPEFESEPEFEPDLDPEPEPEPEFDSDLDPAPEPEVEAVAEPEAPPAIEEHPPADEPIPEPTAVSEELIHPAIEATLEQTVVQPAEVEIESVDEPAPAVETTLVAEQATEQATEISPEPATMPMDLIEPIPEQATEPTHEVAPDPVVHVEARIEAPAVAVAPGPAQEPAAIPSAAPPDASADEPTPPPPAPKPFIKLESRDNEADLSPFSVVVSQVYDGPLDLLLDLIRKQDIDIYDIPIARITSQFLGYVNQLKATDVDVAGEFIYIASLLIHIKSKMLLPRAPAGPDDAAEDPRRELVERLLEHERFKNAAQMLQQKQMLEAATWSNPGLREFQDDTSAEPEIAADTVDLVRIFRDILERARNRPVINLQEDSVTVGQMIQFLSRRLTMEDKPVALRRLLSHTRSERALIAMFLALLELVRLQAILLRQDRAFSEIFIKKHVGFEAVMNDGLANARDDWR
jgi:segregation and condensation protein A